MNQHSQATDVRGTEIMKDDTVTFDKSSGLMGTGKIIRIWSNGTISVRHNTTSIIHKLASSLVCKVWQ